MGGIFTKKLNLVLDIDETLVSAHILYYPKHQNELKQWKNILYTLDDPLLVVFSRPHLIEFIKVIKEYYNIYFYTHGYILHYDNVINSIRKEIAFDVVDHICRKDWQTPVVDKSLENLKLSNNNTIIIDDNTFAWEEKYRHNIINIPPFFVNIYDKKCRDDLCDDYLLVLIELLKNINKRTDIRMSIMQINQLIKNEFNGDKTRQI